MVRTKSGPPAKVQFDRAKLGGRATVGNTRMDADGVLINFESGSSIDEIVESFGVERRAVEQILAFAASRQLQNGVKVLPDHNIPIQIGPMLHDHVVLSARAISLVNECIGLFTPF